METFKPPRNQSIRSKDGKTFRIFMTSRQSTTGRLKTLDHLPTVFHKYVTVVTGKEFAAVLKDTYPELPPIWVTPDSINSAALKRKLIMSSYTEDYGILFNDDVTIHACAPGTTKFVRVDKDPDLFYNHFKGFLNLIRSGLYHGVSFHDRMFANHVVESNSHLEGDARFTKTKSFVGGVFWLDKKLVRSDRFTLGRLNYYEDIDYSLQVLDTGHMTANYVGLVFSHSSTKPTPWHSDRTKEVQNRDRDLLISYFPHAVSKRPPEKLREDLNIDIYVKYSKAYTGTEPVKKKATTSKRTRKLCFVCHGNMNRSAAAHLVAKDLFPDLDICSAGVGKDAGKGRTAKKTLMSLERITGRTYSPIPCTKLVQSIVDESDVVFYMDNSNLRKLTEQFPDSTSKFIPLGALIGERVIKDPGFISDPDKVDFVIRQVRKSILAFNKAGHPDLRSLRKLANELK